MQRRLALKQLALTFGGLVSLPAWAHQWSDSSLPHTNHLSSAINEALLAEVADTIIPATDTPGAKSIGVNKYIQAMISDCFDSNTQERFSEGLSTIDKKSNFKFHQSFIDCNTAQRIEVLKVMEEEGKSSTETKPFFPLLKGLTIHGYLNSEYVMTNLLKYELVPGRFDGCFPIKK